MDILDQVRLALGDYEVNYELELPRGIFATVTEISQTMRLRTFCVNCCDEKITTPGGVIDIKLTDAQTFSRCLRQYGYRKIILCK